MDFLLQIVSAAENFGYWGYLAVFLFAFLEALAFVGGFIPGSTAIVLFGFMCSRGYLDLRLLILVTIVGAILGDSVSYWLGTKGTRFFKKENRFFKAAHLDISQNFFHRHGNKSIFLGRFIGIVRPMVPFAAGLSKMNYRVFLFWNVVSGIAWGISHIYLGYFFGGAFKLIEASSRRLSFLLLILIVIGFLIWLLAKAFRPILSFADRILKSFREYLLQTSLARKFINQYPEAALFIGRRFDHRNFFGWPLTVLVMAGLTFIFLFALVANGVLDADAVTALDQRVAVFLVFFRQTFLIKVFLWIFLLGKFQVIFIIALAFMIALLLWDRRHLIWPFFVLMISCEGTVQFVKDVFNRPRPDGVIPVFLETSQSFPSEHSAIAVTLYGFISYFLVRIILRERHRLYSIWATFMSFIFILFIGFSNLYLGIHYFSDVLGGYLIGGICLLAGIGLFEWDLQRDRGKSGVFPLTLNEKKWLTALLIIGSAGFFLLYGLFLFTPEMIKGKELPIDMVLTTKSAPAKIFSLNKWSKYSMGLTGRKREPITFLIWAKNDQQLQTVFRAAEWNISDEPSIKNLLKMGLAVASGQSYESAPIAPVFWLNQPNDFAFEKVTPNMFPNQHCMRFWQTNLINDGGYVLYAGASAKINRHGSLDLNKEKELVLKDLNATCLVASSSKEWLSDPISAKRAFRIHYFTDGTVVVLYLK